MKKLITILLLLPITAQAQIYRCQTEGDSYFSQIPCDDQAETVVIEDRKMNSGEAEGNVTVEEKQQLDSQPERTPQQKLQDFVATLERQREQQLADIKSNIDKIQDRLSSETDPLGESDQQAFYDELARLQSAFESVEAQYQTMIAEANSRVTVLSEY